VDRCAGREHASLRGTILLGLAGAASSPRSVARSSRPEVANATESVHPDDEPVCTAPYNLAAVHPRAGRASTIVTLAQTLGLPNTRRDDDHEAREAGFFLLLHDGRVVGNLDLGRWRTRIRAAASFSDGSSQG
jgi:hypothetical protein